MAIVHIGRGGAGYITKGQIAPRGVYIHSAHKKVMEIGFLDVRGRGKPALREGMFGIWAGLSGIVTIYIIDFPGVNAGHLPIIVIEVLKKEDLGTTIAGVSIR
jgi:hypothetical protein